MSAKKQKLDSHDVATNVESNIFKGISVFVNGYTSSFDSILLHNLLQLIKLVLA